MTKTEAARKGGLALVKKYGRGYMKTLAKSGAAAFHKKYKLQPLGTSDFAIVNRETGEPIGKTINGEIIRGWKP